MRSCLKPRFFLRRWVAVLSLLWVGCASSPTTAQVNVEIRNYMSEPVSDAEVWFGENKCRVGWLGPTIYKIHLLYPHPITERARVTWKDERGKAHEAWVNLSGVYRPRQSGVLEIGITEGGVLPRLKPLPAVPR
jgi:hypothetical protein